MRLTNLSTGKGICSVGFGTTCQRAVVGGEVVFVEEGETLHCLSLNPLNSIWTAPMDSGSVWDAEGDYVVVECPSLPESTGRIKVLDAREGGKTLNERKVRSDEDRRTKGWSEATAKGTCRLLT